MLSTFLSRVGCKKKKSPAVIDQKLKSDQLCTNANSAQSTSMHLAASQWSTFVALAETSEHMLNNNAKLTLFVILSWWYTVKVMFVCKTSVLYCQQQITSVQQFTAALQLTVVSTDSRQSNSPFVYLLSLIDYKWKEKWKSWRQLSRLMS